MPRPKKPNKIVCPRCKKHKRTKCFVFNRRFKDKICRTCDRVLGNNVYFITLKERKNLKGTIGKFSLNKEEKNELHNEFVRQGMDSIKAWNKVNYHCWLLKRSYGRWKGRQTIERNKKIREEQEAINQKKQLVEGLKNA